MSLFWLQDHMKESKSSYILAGPASSSASGSSSSSPQPGGGGRLLRKRRLNLNALSSLSRPLVCHHRHCGVRLKDGESLDWHYQAHLQEELARLDRGVRVKKNPEDFPDRGSRSRVRRAAADRIRFRREAREALPASARSAAANANDEREPPLRYGICIGLILNPLSITIA